MCEAAPHYASVYQDVARIRARQDAEAGFSGGAMELDVAREKAEHEQYLSEAHVQADERDTAVNKAFSLARFVPLLAERMNVLSPLTRNYIVSWITVLDSVPDLQLVSYLPSFLVGLFRYLSDPNPDVRVATGEVLAEFLREIREAAEHQGGDMQPADASGVPPGAAASAAPADPDASTSDELVPVLSHAVRIDYGAILEILLEQQLSSSDEEIQATTLTWIAEFLRVVKHMVVPFTPRLIEGILPCLAHHSPAIQEAANETNALLFDAVRDLPAPAPEKGRAQETPPLFDSFATVAALKRQLADEYDETRLSALEWLTMLHDKAPHTLRPDDASFDVLLHTLSDQSEEVILADLRLLAQICSASEDGYFAAFMADLLRLFSTDRKLLETRGSLIIRRLCASLTTERVFCTLAKILEQDEDLEFASMMVQNLNMILLTAPELAELRSRLRSLDARESQQLFLGLYRSWSHNAVSAFCLCLLAQAYEHACRLLGIFGELEVTLSMLLQIDKLVQLLESPVFTALRLQLLEPEQHPGLLKCLYGLLMLLPQSSAFATLRNRLNALNGLGYMQAVGGTRARTASPAPPLPATRRAAPELQWDELLAHLRQMQLRHEHARQQRHSSATAVVGSAVTDTSPALGASRPRRRAAETPASISRTSTAMSGVAASAAPTGVDWATSGTARQASRSAGKGS